jgi:hypothetical protein
MTGISRYIACLVFVAMSFLSPASGQPELEQNSLLPEESFVNTDQNKQKGPRSSVMHSCEHEHENEQHHHTHDEIFDHVNHHHHHHQQGHHHNHGHVCPVCGHDHDESHHTKELEVTKYETLKVKADILKKRTLAMFLLASFLGVISFFRKQREVKISHGTDNQDR